MKYNYGAMYGTFGFMVVFVVALIFGGPLAGGFPLLFMCMMAADI